MSSSDTLFSESSSENGNEGSLSEDRPLAYRMSPRSFDEFEGQEHALGPETPLRKAVEADRLSSLIIHGPPGCGKTALARVVAQQTDSQFRQLNAVLAGKDDLREVIQEARDAREIQGKQTVLFLDEIHRFNKAQQDALLPSVEKGTLTLIGATTENPSFYIINALLSRSILIEFHPLEKQQLSSILDRALRDEKRGVQRDVSLTEEAREHLLDSAGGDARRLLNGLEIAVNSSSETTIDLDHVETAIQEQYVEYDQTDDNHYDVASAFIKSIRGSDPDAAIYWLAKMLEAGEDPRFIARRMIIAASEDIGNANPRALQIAIDAMDAVEYVGLPEAQITLAQAVTYLASSPKSNAAYKAISSARSAVEKGLDMPVPDHLRDSNSSKNRKSDDRGSYKYAHDFPNHYVEQDYMPESHTFYEPTDQGSEQKLKQYLETLRSSTDSP
ncbi:MAG: replication-associated recombination protein A [bacterium]